MILTMIKIILTAATILITANRVDTGEIEVQNIIVDNNVTKSKHEIITPIRYDDLMSPICKQVCISDAEELQSEQEDIDSTLRLMGHEDVSIYDNLDTDRVKDLYKALSQATQDADYTVNPISISGTNREILEALVYGEAGDEGFVGQCLVAQCIRDTMDRMNTTDIKKVIKTFKYAGSTKTGTSQSCKDAVEFIFDKGGYVVKQRIIYFYAPHLVSSKFHESQDFVIEWGGHRFFDDSGWN